MACSQIEEPLLAESLPPSTSDRHPCWGYLICAGLVGSWVGQSEVAQAVQVHGYNKPMAITWLNHSAGILVFPALLLGGASARRCWASLTLHLRPAQLLMCTLGLSSVYLLADWLWYIGLAHTSVAAGTAIFNTQSCWVWILSVLMGQPCRWRQILALLASLLGVAIVSSCPGENRASNAPETQESELFGNCFVLASCLGYAVYEVFLDRTFAANESQDMAATSGFVSLSGLMTVGLLWPALWCLAAPGLPTAVAEVPELPPSSEILALLINAMLAVLFNILLALCVVVTSPLITSVACMLTIPTSLAVDALFHGDRFGPFELTGSLFIVAGYVLLMRDTEAKA